MYIVKHTKKFRKSLKKYKKLGSFDSSKLEFVVNTLASGEELDKKYKDHRLSGSMRDYRECHIEPDLLLIYEIIDDELILILLNLGTHSDLFE